MSFASTLRRIVLWLQIPVFAAVVYQNWSTPMRIPSLIFLGVAMALRLVLRVGEITITPGAFEFTGEGGVVTGAWEDIALVVPDRGTLLFLRPIWGNPILLVPEQLEWRVEWVEAGVPVFGLTRSWARRERTSDTFFDRE